MGYACAKITRFLLLRTEGYNLACETPGPRAQLRLLSSNANLEERGVRLLPEEEPSSAEVCVLFTTLLHLTVLAVFPARFLSHEWAVGFRLATSDLTSSDPNLAIEDDPAGAVRAFPILSEFFLCR